jgi:predicted RNA-binding Zn-ribbon protein involved in translation (DUF1610 family)
MSLSCSCGDHDGEGWYYYTPDDFSVLKSKRRKRCVSCEKPIDPGAEVVTFERARAPTNEIEDRIWCGDAVPLANWYMCEECGGLFLSIIATGYCIQLAKGESMRDLIAQMNGDAAYSKGF